MTLDFVRGRQHGAQVSTTCRRSRGSAFKWPAPTGLLLVPKELIVLVPLSLPHSPLNCVKTACVWLDCARTRSTSIRQRQMIDRADAGCLNPAGGGRELFLG